MIFFPDSFELLVLVNLSKFQEFLKMEKSNN